MLLTEAQKIALQVARDIFGDGTLWLVGGWVRDALLNRPGDDIDLTASGSPAEVLANSRRFANATQKHLPGWHISYFPLDPETGTARIVFSAEQEHFYVDIIALTNNSLEADLRRRDFTLNALALSLDKFLASGTVSGLDDFTGGLKDIQARLIRPVSEDNIISDPLRMLRGVRLRAQLSRNTGQQWELAEGALELFRKHAALITRSAGERSGVELNKTLLAGNAEESLRLLDSAGLLSPLIPELDEGKGNIQMPAHFYDVWNHNLVTVDRLEWLVRPDYNGLSLDKMILAARPETVVSFWPQLVEELHKDNSDRLLWLSWGALLHDIGKPRARTVDEQGEIHFYEHQKIGAQMTHAILNRFHFSKLDIQRVSTMVEHHLRLGQLGSIYDSKSGGGVTNRAIFRFLKDTEGVQQEMLPLSLADHAAVVGPWIAQARQLRSWDHHLLFTEKVARKLMGLDEEKLVGKPRLIDGRGLMLELGLKPGPEIGRLLREIEEAQAVGEVTTPEAALELARTLQKQ